MPNLIVEKGKANGRYKPVWQSDEDTRRHKYAALKAYSETHIEPGEKKRLRYGTRKIKQWTRLWT